MNKTPEPTDDASAKALREYARLQKLIEQARVALGRVQQDVAEAESQLGRTQASQLIEVNEQLVLSMLRAQNEAQTAAQALSEVSKSAELDALTGLPNRVVLLDRFAQASANARRHRTRMALLFLDLDDFKQINDGLGHAVGDEVLKLVARRLTSSVREADTVSRHGGDEFVVLLSEVSQASDALAIANKMIDALGAPARVGDHELHLSASIGISVFPDDGEDADTLLSRADAAMYRAKREGLGSAFLHDDAPLREAGPPPPPPDSRRSLVNQRELVLAERERIQAQLHEAREANTQLLLAALSAQELQAAAEQAHQRLTELMAVVAHELRNPLAPIRTAAALLSRVRSEELPRLQAIIERQVMRVLGLVGDLLDVSRVSTGKLRLDRHRVDMGDVIAEAVDACRPDMTARSQHFDMDLPPSKLPVDADPARMAQVVSNLLDNASKYTPNGGRIKLSVAVAGDKIRMTISDNGIGITRDNLPHIFEPFVQEKHAIGFNGVGLGIGLAVVRELVTAHGGTVEVHSSGIGMGSQFIVTLALAAQPVTG